jgi:thiamine biosynthesis lipoprotein
VFPSRVDGEVVATTRAMATDVTIKFAPVRAGHDVADSDETVDAALEVFHTVEKACTRFDPTSPLMRANASPARWHQVPEVLYKALLEASSAHQRTAGRFDPRVLRDLIALGYDRTLAFSTGDIVTPVRSVRQSGARGRGPWRPRFRGGSREVLLGEAVDLGGIGKGLAVRWSSRVMASYSTDFMVEAGGDCYCAGVASDGNSWRIGIEDPFNADEPLAVLSLSDRAATTSSVRLRRWRAGQETVHHLIDPRTGNPGGKDLVAVTVVGKDPAAAEIDSKVLFLAGRDQIARTARRHGIAALWVDVRGEVNSSETMGRHVAWQRS